MNINSVKKFLYYSMELLILFDFLMMAIIYDYRKISEIELVANFVFMLWLFAFYEVLEKPLYKKLYKKMVKNRNE